jgi:hypothetical protein
MTHGTPAEPRSWAVQFPDNLRWTNAMQIVKGMAPYAAVAMDEVDRVGRRLEGRAGEADLDQVWREEWAAMADRVAAVADKAAAEGRQITAGHHYMRAGNYYYSAERFIPPGAEKMARAPPSRHRARRGAVRGHEPAGVFRGGRRQRSSPHSRAV